MNLSKNRIFSQKIDKSNKMIFKNVIINKKYIKKTSYLLPMLYKGTQNTTLFNISVENS